MRGTKQLLKSNFQMQTPWDPPWGFKDLRMCFYKGPKWKNLLAPQVFTCCKPVLVLKLHNRSSPMFLHLNSFLVWMFIPVGFLRVLHNPEVHSGRVKVDARWSRFLPIL